MECLRATLAGMPEDGCLFLEFDVPRLGSRIDAVLLVRHVIFVIEFKIGAREFRPRDLEQVMDYVLDLKHFHETSRDVPMVPVLVATHAPGSVLVVERDEALPGLMRPLCCNAGTLGDAITRGLKETEGPPLSGEEWLRGRYRPTPTIVEAAKALYAGHGVAEIARSDAANLGGTSGFVRALVREARERGRKAACFVTGVPGSGKTLVGLDVAAGRAAAENQPPAVYLSGNGPLVKVLQEALARDGREREHGGRRFRTMEEARRATKAFIQNVHHFRDEGLRHPEPPHEHVAVFDEAQRAWNREQTARFMERRRGRTGFDRSEPAFLLSCLDRHPDWAVVVCLVGNGQEIHTGEAGIGEWLRSLNEDFPAWDIHLSSGFGDAETSVEGLLESARRRGKLHFEDSLHLEVSVRSFRAERYAAFVDRLLALEEEAARELCPVVTERFPLAVTRDLAAAKDWLRRRARGTERYGMVASSGAQRLRPHAIDVRVPIDPVHWFLDERRDPRSSYYLEEAATEFQVQGLELDWTCVVWDADLRFARDGWKHFDFRGGGWTHVRGKERQTHLANAYRVLLTRARQGSVIVVPPGEKNDPTRHPNHYDPTYRYLRSVGIPELPT